MRQNPLDHFILPYVIEVDVSIGAHRQQQILIRVEFALRYERLVATDEAPNELSFDKVMHVKQRVITACGHPRLCVCKLNIVHRKEMVFRLINALVRCTGILIIF
jgi:hypothetical protein